MEYFTFGVLAYNQQSEIVHTLNSIKYQIENYGKGIKCRLIVADDYSKDDTVGIVKKWINNNRELFSEIITSFNVENRGIVANYQFIMSKINDEPFKIIAGDDLISNNNIFRAFDLIGDHTLYNGLRLFFNEKELYINKKYRFLHFWLMNKKICRKTMIKIFRMGSMISTPQTLFRKKLYIDSNAESLNSQFRLFEDNPTWYSMLKNVEDIDVVYNVCNLTLYRVSDKSISMGSNSKSLFYPELYKLYSIYMQEGNIFEKIYFKSAISNTPNVLKIKNYVDKFFFLKCAIYSYIHLKEFKEFENEVKRQIGEGKKYCETIYSMS